MGNLHSKVVSAVLGASGSMAGLMSLSGCPGGVCTSCFGCAGAASGVLLLLLLNKRRMNREEQNGVA